jgi:pimeloyl-ACP methyl ester carboxylesterase
MVRKLLLLLLLGVAFLPSYAQQDDTHMRISLITCGPGDEEVYEVFGHTAIRIVDSTNHTDLAYNYGTFSYGPNFEMQFMRGKLLYSLSAYPFSEFVQEYIDAKRSVQEQLLLLNPKQKEQIYAFLQWNALPENKNYKYDFFFDNCATRIRELFKKVYGPDFHYASVLPPGKAISFRDIINKYFYRDHWTRIGVNILLGSRIDRPMTNEDIMFLPDYLRDAVGGATVGSRKIAKDAVTILPGTPLPPPGLDWPMVLTSLLALLTIAGLSVRGLKVLGRVMSGLMMLVTGLLGVLILIMWFGTDHQGCGNNLNMLWCLPTNLILAFSNPKGKGRYAVIAITLIFVMLLLHVLRIQCLIVEQIPLLLALLFVYGSMYRQSKAKEIVPAKEVINKMRPTFFYKKLGSGPVLVLIHGFPESGTLWRNVQDALAEQYTLIIPDLPGSGETQLERSSSIAEMAEGINNIMIRENIDKAVIAGHSMGGYVAFAFADMFPGKVAGIVAIHSTPGADDEEKKILRQKSINLVQKGGKDVFLQSMVPNLFSDDFKQSHPGKVEEQINGAFKMSEAAVVNFYTAMMEREDLTNAMSRLSFPFLWIIGAKDNVLPYKNILSKSYVSDINFVTFYENCGHMSMIEAPEQLVADMKHFIDYSYKQEGAQYE